MIRQRCYGGYLSIRTTQSEGSVIISQHTLQLFHPLALLYPSICSLGNSQLHVCMKVTQLESVSPVRLLETHETCHEQKQERISHKIFMQCPNLWMVWESTDKRHRRPSGSASKYDKATSY